MRSYQLDLGRSRTSGKVTSSELGHTVSGTAQLEHSPSLNRSIGTWRVKLVESSVEGVLLSLVCITISNLYYLQNIGVPEIMRSRNVAGKIVKKLEIRRTMDINLTYTLALAFGVPAPYEIPSAFLGVMVASHAVG
jgi:hypothetical protein